ncbi:PEP-CTERM sorting domain-containing protein [Massilia sp. G4R7]|uniref:PEP-CTERM sorting domain-containing protein n=1 Tax=Massilia phyllostachyos TaxID=2898585 RepID=A0ABS8Q0N5_9BURK|nr:PEP-CTERM sorting domain-containing protein [Massilia phyllostachyos]MCD2515308.1 PEP-CTERM sorting domain-containing protein [Massilia phyllostachyos]
MKKIRIALAALAFGLAAQSAQASVVTPPDQTFSNNANPAASFALPSAAQNDILIEFTVSYTGVLGNNDFAVFYFGDSNGPNIGLKANCDSSCTNDLFVRMSGSNWLPQNYVNPSDIAPLPASYTLFGRLHKTGTSNNYNRFDLWLNPTEQEKASLTGWDAFATGNSGFSSFSNIGVRTANLNGVTVNFTDISITDVPEPGSVSLLGLAAMGLMAVRRRGARKAA